MAAASCFASISFPLSPALRRRGCGDGRQILGLLHRKIAEGLGMGIGRSAEELVRKVQAAQFVAKHGDQVCPARWKPGKDTLKPGLDLVGKI